MSKALFFYVCAENIDGFFFQSAICTLEPLRLHFEIYQNHSLPILFLQNLFQKIKSIGDVMPEKFGKKCYLCSMKKRITYY